jgi:hypothetical protein
VQWQSSGGKPLTKLFSDTFHRANLANVGPNWVYLSDPEGLSRIHTTQYSVNANAWQAQDTTANQTQSYPECWVPYPIINSAVWGANQFAQARWLTSNFTAARDFRCGVCVMAGITAAGDFQCYILEIDFTPQFQMLKYVAGSYTVLGSFGTPANNDVIKLDVIKNGTTSNTLNCFQNGSNIQSFTDSTNPIQSGWPGLCRAVWNSGATPGTGSFTMDNVSCGVGA